jgi:nickel/cobalt transporter (NicO) family protein
MNAPLASTLAVAAATVGALHALAPDHWLPIAAVARARRWSASRTARVALLCGFGHVTVSALLGVIALVSGTAVVEALGARSGAVAGVLLIGFGAAYGLWGLRRLAHHHHAEHASDPSRTTTWTLFAIYCADPCIAVVPIVFAAASVSRAATVAIVVVYELATIGTMVALAAIARAGAARIRGHWVEHYGDATAGGLIVATGVVVALLGW